MNVRIKILFALFIICKDAHGQKTQTQPLPLDCPSLDKGDRFTQSEFLSRLANECRYDRLLLPTYQTGDVVYVHASAYIYFIQPAEAHDLNFKLHFLLQLRWTDPRLAYALYSPDRSKIIGESDLRQRIWVPHLYMSNEQSSSLMGTDSKDVLISIAPDGEVLFSRRMQAVLYCWMNLQKFPFDDQTCSMNLESWKYNASILRLMWEKDNPVRLSSELHLTEYSLIDYWTNESVVRGDIVNMRLGGGRSGNYSALKFTFKLGREVGYYLMDYFIPSMMIVAMSWVTFWLQADASAPRITLGTATMLSFITLASSQAKTLPKVSYIKASEIWFLGCTGFIFSALVEFAFVNTIWRRKKAVSLKKVNSKYILKSTLTPRLVRKEYQKELQESSPQLSKSRSCSSLQQEASCNDPAGPGYNNYLTVHSYPSALNLPTITTQSFDDLITGPGGKGQHSTAGSDGSDEPPKHHTWTTMTPQEIATWIDKRSRVLFPLLFIFFNIIYWTFVYCL